MFGSMILWIQVIIRKDNLTYEKQHVVALCTIAGVALFCGTKAFAADSDYAIYKTAFDVDDSLSRSLE